MKISGPRSARIALIACILLAHATAHANWLDEMPSVDDVARAVREQNRADAASFRASGGLRSVNGLNPGPRRVAADDQDWYAARLAGTLRMLRWFMMFEALRETNSPSPSSWRPLSRPRESTLARAEQIAATYRRMELALAQGVGKRPSYNKRLCDGENSFLNRLGKKMYTPQECYQVVFERDADLEHIFNYREAMFPRLFCEQGQYYHERYQQYFTDGMSGSTGLWDRPHNYVFKRIDRWPAIVGSVDSAEICAERDRDKDGDGICDAWEAALRTTAADLDSGHCAVCPSKAASGPRNLPARIRLDQHEQQTALTGTFGPYNTESELDAALVAAEPGLWEVTERTDAEFGFLVVKGKTDGKYYMTPPAKGHAVFPYTDFELDGKFFHQIVGADDYTRSTALASVPDGCLWPPEKQEYSLYGVAHTHPHHSYFDQNRFSAKDFSGAIEVKTKEPTVQNYYLYPPDRKVRRYRPDSGHRCWQWISDCSSLDRLVDELP